MTTAQLCAVNDKMAVPTQPLSGYFYDELSKIRVLEPDTAQTTEQLREECKDFVDSKPHTQSKHLKLYIVDVVG